ncbi:hypothetical protein HKD37_19G053666 [Glycine soja]
MCETIQFKDRRTNVRPQYYFMSVVLLRLHNSFKKLTIVSLLEQLNKLLNCYFVSLFHFISIRHLFDNDDLRGAMETIIQNPQLNSAEFYAVTELIPQPQPSSPQPSCPQLQLPPPQQLPYNNIDLNNPVSSYNNLESQDPFDIYTSYTKILSENDSFFHGQQTSFDQQNHPSSPFTPPSQLPQTQTSNRDEHPIANEDPIIRFHHENMDDFTEDKDQHFFDHINQQSDDQSDDQTDDEGVGRPTTPPSPPLQYQQPRCPVDLNFDHLLHYIDRHHFVHQQHNVQPPVEYNIRNHFDCRTIYSEQRRLNFVCKLHENGCTWSLGACNSKRHNKWIIKSIRGHHTCLVPMLRQDHRQLDKHVIAQIIQPIVKTNPTVSIKTLIVEIKTFMNYTPSYKKTWLAKQKALEMIHGNWEESYAKLPKLFGALQSCVPGTVVAAQTESLYEGGEIVLGKRLFKHVFWSFGPCINGFAYCKPIVQVDGTWLYGKYTGTLLIATAQDGANHIFPIAYAIVEGETTSAWGVFLKNLRRHDTSHFFCLRHIAQNFLRGNSNCKHLKKPLMLAGYAYTEKMHWRHLGNIRANKPSAAEWLDQLPKQKWVQCFDEGKRWGHMTKNLSESVNPMFKNTRHLLVSSLVEETYFKTAQLFANRGRQTQAMINSGSQYYEVVFDAINSGQQESNTHIVNEFDRHNHTFIITETQSPLETPKSPGRFRAKHLPCSHVMVVCKSVNVDPMTYVPMIFTL